MKSSSSLLVVICILLVPVTSGCGIRPWFGPPGTVNQQRNNAALYDPFPDNSAGPAIVGGRPLGYDTPRVNQRTAQENPYAR
ncbi:MAG TPA: hypothetical protein PKD64_02420 [Pirellulaceae bacterium]|nr:hypothetical protein [Pirellulaceae bacterium]HMO91023.1 hypothetical protein [Pirellulaceae bacterium]HMP68138.1 hypothetical protein [Pirellulaceae bacterium]